MSRRIIIDALKRVDFAWVLVSIFSRWWVLVPAMSMLGALFAYFRQSDSSSALSQMVAVGAIIGGAGGVLVLIDSVSGRRKLMSSILSAIFLMGVALLIGVILGWPDEKMIVSAFFGGALGLFGSKLINFLRF